MSEGEAVRDNPDAPCIGYGTSTFMSASRMLRATLAPASRQTRATAARVAGTPDVAHAERWSPSGSSCPEEL